MKIIVTHYSPDVDAITSVWLLRKFLPAWKNAEVAFVPAGETYKGQIVDSDPNIFHVDTGMGMLDHHQTDEDTCAAKRTMEYIATKKRSKSFPDEALVRMIDLVNDIDHFREVYYPNPAADYYDFSLTAILDGLNLVYSDNHHKLVKIGVDCLDGLYRTFQNKVWAENEIKREAVEFETKWGKGMGVETLNDDVIKLAQRMGYVLALRKDPKKGYVRIKAMPDSQVNLTSCYNKYRKLDKKATWFLHASKKMVLNGSMKNPKSRATKLTLREIIDVIKIDRK